VVRLINAMINNFLVEFIDFGERVLQIKGAVSKQVLY
jgi:hypothetical protein